MKITWTPGRQNSGYLKWTIFQTPYLDAHILKYPPGSAIPPHKDQVSERRHYRLNIILWAAIEGGQFQCEKLIWDLPRIKLFRPDKYQHSLTKVVKGTRYVLSIGWTRKNHDK